MKIDRLFLVKMVVHVIFVKVPLVVHAQWVSVVFAVKSILLQLIHAILTHVSMVEHAKLLVQTFFDAFAQLVSMEFNANYVSVIPIHVYMVVSV